MITVTLTFPDEMETIFEILKTEAENNPPPHPLFWSIMEKIEKNQPLTPQETYLFIGLIYGILAGLRDVSHGKARTGS